MAMPLALPLLDLSTEITITIIAITLLDLAITKEPATPMALLAPAIQMTMTSHFWVAS
jgi:hypothetical protein